MMARLLLGLLSSLRSSSSSRSFNCSLSRMDKEDLKARLTKIQFSVTQEKDTEPPGTGEYLHTKDKGMYSCLICNQELFPSTVKYESGCGWPAFFDVADKSKVKFIEDNSHGMKRTEVQCSNCSSHLGHIFDDGPKPTGVRYCINSASLKFTKL